MLGTFNPKLTHLLNWGLNAVFGYGPRPTLGHYQFYLRTGFAFPLCALSVPPILVQLPLDTYFQALP